MPYLLDGMNVIHRIDRFHDELEANGPDSAVHLLVKELLRLWPEAQSRLEIVMDGGGGQFGRRTPINGILVRCSARDETADELIGHLILKSPAYYVLVTDDRKLSSPLVKSLTGVMSVKEFFRKICNKYSKSGMEDEKNAAPKDDNINFWMKLFDA